MDSIILDVLLKLKIFSKLKDKKHCKLSFVNNEVQLDPWSYVNGFLRYCRGDNRTQTINFVTNVVSITTDVITLLLENYSLFTNEESFFIESKKQEILNHLRQLCAEMKSAIVGLEVLKDNYRDNTNTEQILDLQINRANALLRRTEENIAKYS